MLALREGEKSQGPHGCVHRSNGGFPVSEKDTPMSKVPPVMMMIPPCAAVCDRCAPVVQSTPIGADMFDQHPKPPDCRWISVIFLQGEQAEEVLGMIKNLEVPTNFDGFRRFTMLDHESAGVTSWNSGYRATRCRR